MEKLSRSVRSRSFLARNVLLGVSVLCVVGICCGVCIPY